MQTAVSSAFRSDTRSEGQKRNPRPDHPFKKRQTDCKERKVPENETRTATGFYGLRGIASDSPLFRRHQ